MFLVLIILLGVGFAGMPADGTALFPPPGPPEGAAASAPARAEPPAGTAPEQSLRKLLDSLEAIRKGALPLAEIEARLAREIEGLRADLEATRAELRKAREEPKPAPKRIAEAERREGRLLARLDAARVALGLLAKRLPRREGLASLSSVPSMASEASSGEVMDPRKAARSRALFREQVGPLFAETCHRCHGGTRRKGDLSLSSRETILKGGSQGPAVLPGKADQSLLYLLISHQKEPSMPPGKELPPEVIEAVREWIETGALEESPAGESRGPASLGRAF